MKPIEFISQFTTVRPFDQSKIYTVGDRYYLLNKASKKILADCRLKPTYLGVYLGREVKDGFTPSVFLLRMLRSHSKKVIVNEKSAWLFLCGRPVLKQGVVKADELKLGDWVLVLEESGEVIGCGVFIKDTVVNKFDLGDFLRRER